MGTRIGLIMAFACAVAAAAWADEREGMDVPPKEIKEYVSPDTKWRMKNALTDPKAQCDLALQYYLGRGEVKDFGEAAKWYRKAADQGYATGQYNMGLLTERGHGVLKDYADAVKWFRAAAKQNHAKAQHKLGMAYREGHGIKPDYIRAHMWFNAGAITGDTAALEARDALEKYMSDRKIAEAQELARNCVANGFKGCD